MSEAVAVSRALTPAQILARLKTVAGQGSGLDADLVHGVGLDGSTFAAGGMIGLPGFGVSVPRSRFQVTYPQSLFIN